MSCYMNFMRIPLSYLSGGKHAQKDRFRLSTRMGSVRNLLAQHGQQPLFRPFLLLADNVQEDLFFVLEVSKDRARTDARPSGDVAGGGAVKPFLEKQLKGGVVDRFALLPAQGWVANETALLFAGTQNFPSHRASE